MEINSAMELYNDLHTGLAKILCILMASRFDRLNNIPQVRHLLHKLAQEHEINPDTIGCVAYLLRTATTRGKRITDSPSSQGAEIRTLIERLKDAEAQARIPPFKGVWKYIGQFTAPVFYSQLPPMTKDA
ncbi:hypothetical protein ACEV6Q_22980 [Enterobacter ludwigii]|uniref:hypothetical protein n=1 Tax=Enterobacter ludwigii TaxID=299767 RepID=UPI003BEED999